MSEISGDACRAFQLCYRLNILLAIAHPSNYVHILIYCGFNSVTNHSDMLVIKLTC